MNSDTENFMEMKYFMDYIYNKINYLSKKSDNHKKDTIVSYYNSYAYDIDNKNYYNEICPGINPSYYSSIMFYEKDRDEYFCSSRPRGFEPNYNNNKRLNYKQHILNEFANCNFIEDIYLEIANSVYLDDKQKYNLLHSFCYLGNKYAKALFLLNFTKVILTNDILGAKIIKMYITELIHDFTIFDLNGISMGEIIYLRKLYHFYEISEINELHTIFKNNEYCINSSIISYFISHKHYSEINLDSLYDSPISKMRTPGKSRIFSMYYEYVINSCNVDKSLNIFTHIKENVDIFFFNILPNIINNGNYVKTIKNEAIYEENYIYYKYLNDTNLCDVNLILFNKLFKYYEIVLVQYFTESTPFMKILYKDYIEKLVNLKNHTVFTKSIIEIITNSNLFNTYEYINCNMSYN